MIWRSYVSVCLAGLFLFDGSAAIAQAPKPATGTAADDPAELERLKKLRDDMGDVLACVKARNDPEKFKALGCTLVTNDRSSGADAGLDVSRDSLANCRSGETSRRSSTMGPCLTPEQRVSRIFASLDTYQRLQPTWRKAKMPAATWAETQLDKQTSAALDSMPDTLNYTVGIMFYLGGIASVNRGDLNRAALSFEAGYALGCLVCGAALATVLDLDPARLPIEPDLAQDWNDLAAHAGVSSAAGALVDLPPKTYQRLISGDGATMPTTTGSTEASAVFIRAYTLGDAYALSVVERAKAGDARAVGILQKAKVDIGGLPETTSSIVNRFSTSPPIWTPAQRAQDIETLTARAEGGDATALLAFGTRHFPDPELAFDPDSRSEFLIEAAVRGNPMSMAAFADSVLSAGEASGFQNDDAAIFAFAAWTITPVGDPSERLFRGVLDGLMDKLQPKVRKALQVCFKQQAEALDHIYP